MSITVEGVVILRAGKICPQAIARLSIDQLKRFLIIHALVPHPEALGALGVADVLAAVRAELASRGVP